MEGLYFYTIVMNIQDNSTKNKELLKGLHYNILMINGALK